MLEMGVKARGGAGSSQLQPATASGGLGRARVIPGLLQPATASGGLGRARVIQACYSLRQADRALRRMMRHE